MNDKQLFKTLESPKAVSMVVVIRREHFTHLVPAKKYKQDNNNQLRMSTYERFALPLSQPMAYVVVRLQKANDTNLYGGTELGEALEIGHKDNAEWVAELCPQYTGFPIKEVK